MLACQSRKRATCVYIWAISLQGVEPSTRRQSKASFAERTRIQEFANSPVGLKRKGQNCKSFSQRLTSGVFEHQTSTNTCEMKDIEPVSLQRKRKVAH
jgi:hypothetical protein